MKLGGTTNSKSIRPLKLLTSRDFFYALKGELKMKFKSAGGITRVKMMTVLTGNLRIKEERFT